MTKEELVALLIEKDTKVAKEVVKSYSRNKAKGKPKRAKLPDTLPVVEVIIEQEEGSVDGWIKIGEAINYALNRWKYVKRYLEDGKLEIDNNLVENAIRPVAIGRKNYLFCGSEQGAQWAAVIYSLLASASNCGHNPFEYLKDVLQRLPDQPITHLHELLPTNWKPLQEGMAWG